METADTKYLALNYTQERWVKLRNINDIRPKAQGDQLRKVAAQMQNSQKGWPQILDKVYQYPSDRRYADIHKAANAFGEQLQWLKDPKICICCEMPINTRPISLDYPTIPKPPPKDHKHFQKFKLKSSTSIFFSIIKIFIAYLLIRIIISDSYNIYTSYRGSYCLNLLSNNSSTTASQSTQQHQTQNLIRNHLQAAAANSTPINASTSPNTQSEKTKESCVQDFRASFSNYNKHSQQDAKTFKLMDYLNIAVTLVSIMFFLYCRQQLYKINNLIEFDRVSQDNYSLLVENIPLFLYKPDLDPPQEGFTRVNNYGIKQTYGLTQSGLEYNYEQVIKKTIQDQSKSWLKPLQKINQEIKKNIAQNLQKCPLQSDISQEQQLRMVHKRTQLQKKLINLQQLEHITDPFIIEHTSKLKNKLLNILFKQSQSGAKVAWKKRWLEMDQFIHREEELVKQSSKIGQLTICFDSKQIEHLNYIRQQLMNKHSNNVGQDPTYTNSIKMEEYRLLLASKHEKFVPNQVKQINTIQVRKINEYLGYFQHIQPTKLIPLENKLSSVQEEELKQFIVLNFLGKAFVTFQHEYFKDYLLDEYAKNSSFLQIQGNVLQISQASEPTDVNWQNLRFTSEQRSKQGMLSLVSIYTTFLAFFVILFAINYVANMQKDLNVQSNPGSVGFVIDSLWSKVKTFLFEFLLPTTITITNLLVKKLINKFTEEERHISVQKKTYRYVQRTIQFQFLNTAILYFILGFIQINGGPLSQEGFVIKTLNLIGMTFLLQFVITNFKHYFSSVFTFLDPINSLVPAEGESQQGSQYKFVYQKQLNKLAEYKQFNCAEKYISYIGQIFLVTFYSMLIPLGPILLAIIFFIQYKLDKKTLFGESCLKQLNFRITKNIWYLFEHIILIAAVGNFIIDSLNFAIPKLGDRKNNLIVSNVINITISALYLIVTFFCNEFLFSTEKVINNKQYSTNSSKVYKTYESQNYVAKYKNYFKRFNKPIGMNEKQVGEQIDRNKLMEQEANQKKEQHRKYKQFYQQQHKWYDFV